MLQSVEMQFSSSTIAYALITTLIVFLVVLSAAAMTSGEPGQPIHNEMATALDSPSEAPTVEKYAVIIGIVYPDFELGVINHADQDARAVYDLLTLHLGYPEDNVVMLQNVAATRENIMGALQWLTEEAGVDSDDQVVFFYSGHGLRSGIEAGTAVPDMQRSYAMVPHDYREFDYEKGQGLIWDFQLSDYLEEIQPGRMWIAIDSCFSGGFAKPGITGPSRVITMSSQADQLSNEIDHTRRGVMTQLLVEEGLKQGVTVEEAFWNIYTRAAVEFGQNPQIWDGFEGQLSLK